MRKWEVGGVVLTDITFNGAKRIFGYEGSQAVHARPSGKDK
jgi:hypothetical protein